MFEFWSRGTQTASRETEDLTVCRGVQETEAPPTGVPGTEAVADAVRIIQKHVDKEARNRWVEHLEVKDLCPRQKADLVADLAHIFR